MSCTHPARLLVIVAAVTAAVKPASAGVAPPRLSITDLGTLPGGTRSYATAINAAGQVVGNSFAPPFPPHAFRTAPGGPITAESDLGTFPGGEQSYATGINAAGQVVGESTTASTPTDGFYH